MEVQVIVPDKSGYPQNIFLISGQKHNRCGYSLEAPHRGASDEYQQHMFSSRYKKIINTFRLKKVPYLEVYQVIAGLDLFCSLMEKLLVVPHWPTFARAYVVILSYLYYCTIEPPFKPTSFLGQDYPNKPAVDTESIVALEKNIVSDKRFIQIDIFLVYP